MNGFSKVRFGLPVLVALVSLTVSLMGCASNSADDAMVEPPPSPDSEFDDRTETIPDTTVSNAMGFDVGTVYFAFDKSTINEDAKQILTSTGNELIARGIEVTIAGHCDEQGSYEYNLALGERRAEAVRRFLYNVGVPLDRMNIVSYGESRPAVRGSGEAAWRLNRRAEITSRP